jgi:hypothetical protein
MIVLAAAMMLAGGDADLRHDFVACLKSASTKAQSQKIGVDGFVAFAKSTCADSAEPFKATLVNADIQHGMSRKESNSDAESQLSDYYSEWHDKYAADAPPPAAVKPAQPPAPTPASEPTTPK